LEKEEMSDLEDAQKRDLRRLEIELSVERAKRDIAEHTIVYSMTKEKHENNLQQLLINHLKEVIESQHKLILELRAR
jgi:hypothetical protein